MWPTVSSRGKFDPGLGWSAWPNLPVSRVVSRWSICSQLRSRSFEPDRYRLRIQEALSLHQRCLTGVVIFRTVSNYNATVAGQATPAGQVLIQNGLMTTQQLVALGGVAPTVPLAPPGQVDLTWLRTMDMTLAWTYTIKERFTIKPSVGFYNILNFTNFDLPESMMSGLLAGSTGTINGTNYAGAFVNRVGVGTGVYSLGSPRQIEFALKLTF